MTINCGNNIPTCNHNIPLVIIIKTIEFHQQQETLGAPFDFTFVQPGLFNSCLLLFHIQGAFSLYKNYQLFRNTLVSTNWYITTINTASFNTCTGKNQLLAIPPYVAVKKTMIVHSSNIIIMYVEMYVIYHTTLTWGSYYQYDSRNGLTVIMKNVF